MKRLYYLVALLVGALIIGVMISRLVSPEIVIANAGSIPVREVIVQLPSSRVVFGAVQSGGESAIYYGASQADGAYEYSVLLEDGSSWSGRCGYVTDSDHGKRLRLTILGADRSECVEDNKLF